MAEREFDDPWQEWPDPQPLLPPWAITDPTTGLLPINPGGGGGSGGGGGGGGGGNNPEPGTTRWNGDHAEVWNGSAWVPYDENSGYRGGSPDGYVPNRNVGGGATSGGGGGGRANLPAFNFNPGPAPMFDAPTFNRRADFVAPDWKDIGQDPGYQFRLEQGLGALSHKYASLGNLATGGAKKGFIDYNQAAASQEYDNVYNRALGTYKTNFAGDLDAYDRLFQEQSSEFAPKFAEWQTLAQLGQRGAELNFNRDWDQFTFGSDDEFRRSESGKRLLEAIYGGGIG